MRDEVDARAVPRSRRTSFQSPYAAAMPAFAAAGSVATDTSTPMSAPDFAVLSESIPAAPAHTATKNEKKSGEAMTFDRLWSSTRNSSGVRPVAWNASENSVTAQIASGKPTASAAKDRSASDRGGLTSATHRPASGPNSGPTTIPPTSRIVESRKRPTEAMSAARTMNARNENDRLARSDVCVSHLFPARSRPRGRPAPPPPPARPFRRAGCRSSSSEIEPSTSIPRSRRSPTTTLASSRATSQRTRSPGGLRAAPRSSTTLQTESIPSSNSTHAIRLVAPPRRCAGAPSARI